MKKAFSNLNKAIPPKARIAILTVFFGIGVITYLTVSVIFSGNPEDTPADNGLFAVDTKINSSTEVNKNPLLSEKNSINTKLDELKATDIDNKKNGNNSDSYFAGVNLDKKVGTGEAEESVKNKKSDSVIDLSSMFNGSEFDARKKESEEKSKSDINKLENKLGIPEPKSPSLNFNRKEFLAEVETELSESGALSMQWVDITKSSSIKIASYNSGDEKSNNTPTSNTSNTSGSSISKANVDKRREQYLARYDEMKTDLDSRLNGNTKVIEDSQGNTSNNKNNPVTSQDGEEYTSNARYGAGEIMYAINDIEIVSDESNVVRVTIAQNGDTYGAILLGSFTQIGDVLGLKFSSYTVDNKSYPINAIAIDSSTWKSGLADEVDQHYFSRYFGIIAAALVQGYSETLTNTSTTVTDAGVSDSSDRIESTSERLQAAVGKVGEVLAPTFLKNVTKQSTVTIYRDKGLGIMVMEDFRVPARN
jgi:hypothetical protein